MTSEIDATAPHFNLHISKSLTLHTSSEKIKQATNFNIINQRVPPSSERQIKMFVVAAFNKKSDSFLNTSKRNALIFPDYILTVNKKRCQFHKESVCVCVFIWSICHTRIFKSTSLGMLTRLSGLSVNRPVKLNVKCLRTVLCGVLGSRRCQLIIGEHVQQLLYESLCLITNGLLSVHFRFMGRSGSFHTSGRYDIRP